MPLLSLSLTQLLLAFVSASILHKLILNRFYLRWLSSHRFVYYLPPSDNQLRNLKNGLAIKPNDNGKKQKPKSRRKHENLHASTTSRPEDDTFKVQASNLQHLYLERASMTCLDLESIVYAIDLEWLVDLSLMSTFSYFIAEVQFFFYPGTKECNFSLIWAILVICYCVRTLWNLTSIYFKNEESLGERSICIVSGCMFLLVSMIVLITNENYLEFGLDNAYRSFNQSATAFVNNHTLSLEASRVPNRPISYIIVKLIIATMCCLTGVMFTFPGLRFGQLHKDISDRLDTTTFQQAILNLNYLSPLFITLLWVKPIARDLVVGQSFLPLDDTSFESIRLYCVVIVSVYRFYLVPKYLAIFLLSADKRILKIKYRGGATTNREIQITVASIYKYANVVVIQYILPVLMSFFTVLLLKSLGSLRWLPDWTETIYQPYTSHNTSDSHIQTFDITTNITSQGESDELNWKKIYGIATSVTFGKFKEIFSDQVFRGIIGFAVWWIHFTWFCTSTMGLIYHTYFSAQS